MEAKAVVLPPLPNTDEVEAKTWQFTRLIEEQAVGSIRPDIVASIDDETVFIEVAVTSFVDIDKLDFIKRLGIKTVEIDLREILSQNVDIPSEEARLFILDQVDNKKWLYPEAKEIKVQSEDWLSTLNMHSPNENKITNEKDIQLSKSINNYIKYRFIINGVWVDAWLFSDGGISVKSVKYNEEIVELLRHWRKEGGGWYNSKFKASKYYNPFAKTVLQRLQEMDTTPKT